MEPLQFEWDDIKRLSNLAKHHLDFEDAGHVFDRPRLSQRARTEDGEPRWMEIGMLEDVCVAIIYTWRGSVVRLISMRKARDDERRHYDQKFAGTDAAGAEPEKPE